MMNPPRLPAIAALAPNAAGYGFFLCLSKEARQGRGGDYLSLLLQDRSGQIPARIFDNVAHWSQEFEAGEFVRVQGRTQLHTGRLQLLVERIRRVIEGDARDGFREDDCTEVAPRPVDEMWAELESLVATGVESVPVRRLLEEVLHRHGTRLRVWPAALSVHHAYRSGLLEHVLSVAETARALARAHGANVDVVTAGALLHDIGKLRELDYDTAVTYTREGNLLGHITIGAMMVQDAATAVPELPDALREHIQHIVLSHHGERELGSPVVPMTAEAFIVAAADDLDAKLNQVRRAVAADAAEGEFTAYQGRLERKLWKGNVPVSGDEQTGAGAR